MTTPKLAAALVGSVLFALLPLAAQAGDFDVIINGKSHHINSHYDWNEENLGVGFEYEFDSYSPWVKSVNANAFKDSLDNMSYMAGAGLKRRLYMTDHLGGLYVDAGIVAFLMSRKDINNRTPFPGVLPVLTIGNDYAGLNFTYLPKKAVHDIAHADVVDPTIGGVLFMQLKLPMHAFGFK